MHTHLALALAAAIAPGPAPLQPGTPAGVKPRAGTPTPPDAPIAAVTPDAETTPVASDDDAADDPAIWIHPTDPARSLILGTDKDAGIGVYDLGGRLLRFLPVGRPNNIDLRQGFGGLSLAVASDRADETVLLLAIDEATGAISILGRLPTDLEEIYGIAAGRTGDDLHIIANDQRGRVRHWVWADAGTGARADARDIAASIRLARAFEVGGQPEGMVVDEPNGVLFIGEEAAGIWRYPLDPGAEPARTLVDAVTPVGRHLTADVEGLAIVRTSETDGFLVASSQGSDRFVAYDRRTGRHAFTFRIDASPSIDGVTGTDGIDATATPLGPMFRHGVLVVQDGDNAPDRQNFKLVCWRRVMLAADPPR